MKSGRSKKSWDEVVKEEMKKRGMCINDAQDRNKQNNAAEECSVQVNWEKDPAIKTERGRP